MNAIFWLINTLIDIAFWIIIIQVVLSWLINFNVINLHQPFVHQIWTGINRITEPIYRPIRRILPDLGGIDLAPMIVLIGLLFLQRFLILDVARAL